MTGAGTIVASIATAGIAGALALYTDSALTPVVPVVTGWDVVFDVVANPIYLGQVVLTVWLLLTGARLPRLVELPVTLRYQQRARLLVIEARCALRQAVGGAAVVTIALFSMTFGSSWRGWGEVSLMPGGGILLAQRGWEPVPLLLVSIAQLLCVLVAIRVVAVTVALLTASTTPAAVLMAVLWLVEALSTLEVSGRLPFLSAAAASLSTDQTVRAGVPIGFIVAATAIVGGTCWFLLVRRDQARCRGSARRGESVPALILTLTVAALAADTLARRPQSTRDAVTTLLAGHTPDLLAYVLYSSVGLSFALAVMYRLERQLDGRLWQELIRAGSWTRWLRLHLALPLLLIPAYLAVVLLIVLLSAGPSLIRVDLTVLPMVAVAYFAGGTLQIALYVAVIVSLALCSGDVRWAWIAVCGIFLLGSPFVPNSQFLPIGLYSLDPAHANWTPVMQHLMVLLTWGTASLGLLLILTRKRVLRVAI